MCKPGSGRQYLLLLILLYHRHTAYYTHTIITDILNIENILYPTDTLYIAYNTNITYITDMPYTKYRQTYTTFLNPARSPETGGGQTHFNVVTALSSDYLHQPCGTVLIIPENFTVTKEIIGWSRCSSQ